MGWFVQSNNKVSESNIGIKGLFVNFDFKNNPDFKLK
jgi:hypothetical protein